MPGHIACNCRTDENDMSDDKGLKIRISNTSGDDYQDGLIMDSRSSQHLSKEWATSLRWDRLTRSWCIWQATEQRQPGSRDQYYWICVFHVVKVAKEHLVFLYRMYCLYQKQLSTYCRIFNSIRWEYPQKLIRVAAYGLTGLTIALSLEVSPY